MVLGTWITLLGAIELPDFKQERVVDEVAGLKKGDVFLDEIQGLLCSLLPNQDFLFELQEVLVLEGNAFFLG